MKEDGDEDHEKVNRHKWLKVSSRSLLPILFIETGHPIDDAQGFPPYDATNVGKRSGASENAAHGRWISLQEDNCSPGITSEETEQQRSH